MSCQIIFSFQLGREFPGELDVIFFEQEAFVFVDTDYQFVKKKRKVGHSPSIQKTHHLRLEC